MISFFDSNIVVYLLEDGTPKRRTAKRLLNGGGIVSVQVLNEFTDVARRKYKLDFDEISDVLEALTDTCRVVPVTLEIHSRGIAIARRANLRIYDACLDAAAELSGCDVMQSEDMNHGQRIGGVTIHNPFI